MIGVEAAAERHKSEGTRSPKPNLCGKDAFLPATMKEIDYVSLLPNGSATFAKTVRHKKNLESGNTTSIRNVGQNSFGICMCLVPSPDLKY